MTESFWLTPEEAAKHVKCKTLKSFNHWVQARGVPAEGKRGRLRLFTTATLDRVLRNDARPMFRKVVGL